MDSSSKARSGSKRVAPVAGSSKDTDLNAGAPAPVNSGDAKQFNGVVDPNKFKEISGDDVSICLTPFEMAQLAEETDVCVKAKKQELFESRAYGRHLVARVKTQARYSKHLSNQASSLRVGSRLLQTKKDLEGAKRAPEKDGMEKKKKKAGK